MLLAAAGRRCPTEPAGLRSATDDRPSAPTPRRDARPVRRRLPARRAARHRHERPADEPGLPAGDPGAVRRYGRSRLVTGAVLAVARSSRSSTSCTSARAGSSSATGSATTSCRSPCVLVALGFERLATPASLGHAARHRPRRRVGRDQRCGASSGAGSSDGDLARVDRGRRRLAARRRASSLLAARACAWPLLPGRRLLGHRRVQAVGAALGTAHPTGFPTYVLLGWLANVAPAAVRRAGVPDEPAVAVLAVATAAAVDRRSWSGALTRSTVARRSLAGLGLALDARSSGRSATHAEPHRSTWPSSPSCCGCWSRWEDGPPASAAPRQADRCLLLAAVVFGLAVGNHSLTLLLARRSRCTSSRSSRGIRRRPRLVARVRRRGGRDARARLPRAARCGPGRSGRRSSTAARDLGRVLVHRPRPSSSGAASSTRSATCRQGRPILVDLTVASSARSRPRSRSAFVVAAIRRPPVRAADRDCGAAHHLLLRRRRTSTPTSALLPRAGR